MKHVERRQHQAIKLGDSLVTSLPWLWTREYNLKKGDPIISYQFNGMLVLVPLAYLGTIGEPKIVRLLREAEEL